ncbi:MAG: TIGR00266 family protein [Nitrososphaera sp.]|uniref:TIGR00266 family protein n=1 Tax=Nitrososphaera sp. TaxID=1971748 RepID=UPI00183B9A26|nr:TIGR00266 family protein [Nitrososphaera sp.]NWG37590.1 TIGR00266 family protein [Nitrososphaera sp.]
MHYRIVKEPMALLEVDMSAGEKITAESGAMVYMKGDIEIKTRTREGGFLKKLKVTALGGESFFVNDFMAKGDCSVGLTGPPIGDIIRLDVKPGAGFIVQSGSYVASSSGVMLDTQWQGFTKGLFGSEFFMLKVTGQGELFANAYGGIVQKDLAPGEKMTVDNYHLVALGESVRYNVIKVGGMKTTILGGEGLATECTGPGPVYFQTKNLRELVDLLGINQRAETTSNTGVSFGGFRIG